MPGTQQPTQSRTRDQDIREALDQHRVASNAGDFATEHEIYHEDAVLDYPQSRERIRGRGYIQVTRTLQPNKKQLVVHRIMGDGDLWITDFEAAECARSRQAPWTARSRRQLTLMMSRERTESCI